MFGFGRKKVDLLAPFEGEVVTIDAVPDPVFSQKMLGEGFAVRPADDAGEIDVCAPCAGKLVKVFKTGHAFALVSTGGVEILVHIGLDTVELKGEGFTKLLENGAEVEAGQPVIRVNVARVRELGRDPITPVICTKKGQVSDIRVATGTGSNPAATITLA